MKNISQTPKVTPNITGMFVFIMLQSYHSMSPLSSRRQRPEHRAVAEAGAYFAEHAQGDEQDRDGDDQGESATRRG